MSDASDPKPIATLVPDLARAARPVSRRRTSEEHQALLSPKASSTDTVVYAHTVLCQTVLPYKDPGDDVRSWERVNGNARLKVIAGEAMVARTQRFEDVGLPFGPKPRLIMAWLNAQAIIQKRPDLDVGVSLSAFSSKLKLDNGGRTTNTIREQLRRLSASTIRLGLFHNGHAMTVNTQVVTAFDLWEEAHPSQKSLWAPMVRLGAEYYASLREHAVPIREEALMNLRKSAMALDCYCWLSQRLHRVEQPKGQFLAWSVLKDQFGFEYSEVRFFRRDFLRVLDTVQRNYPAALVKIDEKKRGITIFNSPPPVPPRTSIVVTALPG